MEALPLSRDSDLAALSAMIALLQHIFALRCAFTRRSDCFVGGYTCCLYILGLTSAKAVDRHEQIVVGHLRA